MKKKKNATTNGGLSVENIKKSSTSRPEYQVGHTQVTETPVTDDQEDSRPFACPHCDSRFKNKQHLSRHARSHTGERPYECSYCQLTFGMNESRKDHENSKHIKELKYECLQCPKKFYIRSCLLAHVYRHHQSSKLFKCAKCPQQFATQGFLNHHAKHVHGPKYHECVACNVKFSRASELKRHFKSHKHNKATVKSKSSVSSTDDDEKPSDGIEMPVKTFKCKTCSKSYKTKNGLKNHKEKKGHITKKGAKVISQIFRPAHSANDVLKLTPSNEKSSFKINSEKSREVRKDQEKKEVQSKPLMFLCKTCSKSYKTKERLKRHREKRGHTTKKGSKVIPQNGPPVEDAAQLSYSKVDEKNKLDGKIFTSSEITSAKSLHLKNEPEKEEVQSSPLTFGCTTCSNSYKTKERLKRHGERRGHSVKEKSKMMNKIEEEHNDDTLLSDKPLQEEEKINDQGKSFCCPTCPKSYKTRARLERHCARRGHDGEDEPEVTNQSSASKTQRQVSKLEVDFSPKVGKNLKRKESLKMKTENHTTVERTSKKKIRFLI